MNPRTDVRFRGKPIDELSREELVEALTQALTVIYTLSPPELVEASFAVASSKGDGR